MLRTIICCLLSVLTMLIGGCDAGEEHATPGTATMESTGSLAVSVLPTPTPLVQQPPSPVATATPAPGQVIVVQPTSLPYVTHLQPEGTNAIPVTPVPAAPLLTCAPEGAVVACQDELLNVNFRYPAFMGQVLYTMLRRGLGSGYFYEYEFDNRGFDAGGRSRDFSEGRGEMYTDQMGFGGRTPAEICAGWDAALCRQLSPYAIIMVLLPRPERLCADAVNLTDVPRGILVLDLPDHPLINGFAFAAQLLSTEAEAALRDSLPRSDVRCDPGNLAALSAFTDRLRQQLAAGQIPPELQERYDAMAQLAVSLESPYLPGAEAPAAPTPSP